MSDYVYQPYPRRLYLNGEVIAGDLHATNSVVVESAEAEAEARAKGYATAYEKVSSGAMAVAKGEALHPFTPPASEQSPPNQGIAADASPDPIADDVDDIEALRIEAEAAGVTVDRRWKEARLRQEIESAKHPKAKGKK